MQRKILTGLLTIFLGGFFAAAAPAQRSQPPISLMDRNLPPSLITQKEYPERDRGVVTYLTDRVYDFADIFRLRGGFPKDGRGFGAKVRATSLLQAGYVFFDGHYAGIDRRGLGIVSERRQEYGISLLYGSFNEMIPAHGNAFLKANTLWSDVSDRRILRNLPYWDDGRERHLSLGVEVATPILAVDAGLYPAEALDFALGFVMLDIFKDDELFMDPPKYRRPTTPPGPNMDAPFMEKRADIQEEFAELLRAEMEATGQLPPGEEAGMGPPETGEALPAGTRTIPDQAADEAMRMLDEGPGALAQPEEMEPTQAPNLLEGAEQPEAPEEGEAPAEEDGETEGETSTEEETEAEGEENLEVNKAAPEQSNLKVNLRDRKWSPQLRHPAKETVENSERKKAEE